MTTTDELYRCYLAVSDAMADLRNTSPPAILAVRDQVASMARDEPDCPLTGMILACAEATLVASRAAAGLPADWRDQVLDGAPLPELDLYLVAVRNVLEVSRRLSMALAD